MGAILLLLLSAAPWQPFTAFAISADGQWLASGGLAGEVLWRDVKTGEVLRVDRVDQEKPVAGLRFEGGTTQLLVALSDGRLYAVELEGPAPVELDPTVPLAGSLLETVRRWRSEGPTMSGVSATFAGGHVRGFPDGHLELQSEATIGQRSWQAHEAAVTGLAWSSDGALIYSCSFDGTIAIWVAATGNLKSRLSF